jgi:hypothetical protein
VLLFLCLREFERGGRAGRTPRSKPRCGHSWHCSRPSSRPAWRRWCRRPWAQWSRSWRWPRLPVGSGHSSWIRDGFAILSTRFALPVCGGFSSVLCFIWDDDSTSFAFLIVHRTHLSILEFYHCLRSRNRIV